MLRNGRLCWLPYGTLLLSLFPFKSPRAMKTIKCGWLKVLKSPPQPKLNTERHLNPVETNPYCRYSKHFFQIMNWKINCNTFWIFLRSRYNLFYSTQRNKKIKKGLRCGKENVQHLKPKHISNPDLKNKS